VADIIYVLQPIYSAVFSSGILPFNCFGFVSVGMAFAFNYEDKSARQILMKLTSVVEWQCKKSHCILTYSTG
jgi:hypothetical protein